MKKAQEWARRKNQGVMRWDRDGNCLTLQWKDNRPVTMLTSIHVANEFRQVDKKAKVDNRWQNVKVQQPKAIDEYKSI